MAACGQIDVAVWSVQFVVSCCIALVPRTDPNHEHRASNLEVTILGEGQ